MSSADATLQSLSTSDYPDMLLDNTLGAVLIGVILVAVLFGVTTVQTMIYYTRSKRDPRYLRYTVAFLWYYTRRVWIITGVFSEVSKKRWFLTLVPAIFTVVTFVFGLGFAGKIFSYQSTLQFERISWMLYLGMGSSAAADLWVAISLCYFLRKAKTGFKSTDTKISILMIYIINTGMLTSLCAILCLVMYIVMPRALVFVSFFFCLPKLYFNSMLAMMNAREIPRDTHSKHAKSFGAGPGASQMQHLVNGSSHTIALKGAVPVPFDTINVEHISSAPSDFHFGKKDALQRTKVVITIARASGRRFRAPSVYDSSDDDDDDDDDLSSDDLSSIDLDISVDSARVSGLSDSDDEQENVNARFESELLLLPWDKLRISGRAPEEEQRVMETVASIRNHVRHVDAYEEWESHTRKDAFHTARRLQSSLLQQVREGQRNTHVAEQQRLDMARSKEVDYLRVSMEAHKSNTAAAERQLRERWKERDRQLWERIEKSIKEEEDKLRAKEEAERKIREEEERKRKEEEERKKREEEEKKQKLEEERKKALEEKLKKEMEEMERKEREEKAQQEKAKDEGSLRLRESLGMIDSDDLWRVGLQTLRHLKTVTMRVVKGAKPPDPEPEGYKAPPPPPLKKLWSAQRRKITPKIGQLTDDPREIVRITEEIKAIVAPIPNMPKPDEAQHLHHALLSSFAKTVILQAETEVTAHKAQAGPLAQVAIALIVAYPPLGDIFWARLCEQAGCWAAGVEPSMLEDENSETLSAKAKRKRWGARPEEGLEEKMTRLAGVLRLYFRMLFISLDTPTPEPLPPPFRPGRYWLYLAQLLNNQAMLEKAVAPEIVYVALDEGGLHAKYVWGKQFIKMLQLICEGMQGEGKTRFGGTEVLAQASRARCQLEIEKIMTL
ncbi:hypothetical protein EW145_g2541 [Phellinidium pouzarii]|uniref:mRNA export factor GLE1 n=1 Tax=Phellinidium pouzarii TaxID=167371 RepID=A0A4V3XD77_9AGAM|nr:hypothetical protein EW145_g2541 [Phellinidium pouzarii]